MVARFSSIAGIALIAVAIPGIVLAWSEVRTLDALTSTTYGWVLVAKVTLVALVALRRRLQPLPPRARAAGPRQERLCASCGRRCVSRSAACSWR